MLWWLNKQNARDSSGEKKIEERKNSKRFILLYLNRRIYFLSISPAVSCRSLVSKRRKWYLSEEIQRERESRFLNGLNPKSIWKNIFCFVSRLLRFPQDLHMHFLQNGSICNGCHSTVFTRQVIVFNIRTIRFALKWRIWTIRCLSGLHCRRKKK